MENHRKNGKAYTTFADNKDVMLAEELQEIFKESPAYSKSLDFIIPDIVNCTYDNRDFRYSYTAFTYMGIR